jgi:peptide/nickel transport system substrate-binding protein
MIATSLKAAFAGLLMGLTTGIGLASAADTPKQGGKLIYGIESEIPWMDPHVVFGGSNKRVVKMAFEGLVDRDRSDPSRPPPLAPALAESWEVLENGTVYRFHLRQGIKFHDGTPFDAAAVEFNFKRIIDPSFQYYYKRTEALKNGPLRYLKDVKVVDPKTVDLILSQAWSPFLDQLSTTLSAGLPLMVSPESVKKYGNEGVNQHPIGTGPFKIVSYGPGVQTVLQRNPDYWNKPYPYLDEVDFVVLPEESTRVTALESGEVDMITAIPPDRIASLKQEGFTITMPQAMNLVWFIGLNVKEPGLSDVRVRQAINYAIDRKGIAEQLLGGSVSPISAMVPGTSVLWNTDLAQSYSYDPAKAKALLAEAGVTKLSTTVQLPTGGSYMITPVPAMEWVQRDLAAVGITLKLETFDWVTYLQHWLKGLQPGVGMNIMSWGTDYDEWWADDIFTTKGFANTGHIDDQTIDAGFSSYVTTLDPKARQDIAYKIFKRGSEQAYFVPIASDRAPIASAAKVKGVLPIPDWMQDFRGYWIEK